jgi:hypothetical protein
MRSRRIRKSVVPQAAMEMDGLDEREDSYHQYEEKRRMTTNGAASELAVRCHSVQMKSRMKLAYPPATAGTKTTVHPFPGEVNFRIDVGNSVSHSQSRLWNSGWIASGSPISPPVIHRWFESLSARHTCENALLMRLASYFCDIREE